MSLTERGRSALPAEPTPQAANKISERIVNPNRPTLDELLQQAGSWERIGIEGNQLARTVPRFPALGGSYGKRPVQDEESLPKSALRGANG